ncbi:MAG TPA: hypothetical protein VMF66_17295 [Candidatus Acidoferrum sp.]|nr:hypothetical protein [Candidatus Acidoferrum sp.]
MPKDFVIRLRCPYGDGDRTVLLQEREETLAQILEKPWDFECPVHGVQREVPFSGNEKGRTAGIRRRAGAPGIAVDDVPVREEAKPRSSPRISIHIPVMAYGWSQHEISFHESSTTLLVNASGGLITLAAKVSIGDTIFVVNQTTSEEQECRVAYVGPEFEGKLRVGFAFKRQVPSFWKIDRHEVRISKPVKVTVHGTDRKGQKYSQTAMALDISKNGARLDGVGFLTWPGEVIEVKRGWKSARFRVIWVGDMGPRADQAGIFLLDTGKNIWGVPL